MKILKTKQEKKVESIEKSGDSFKIICDKVGEFGKLTIEFDRSDFKKNMSTTFGFGFQDMKREHRLTITECIKKYDVKFAPIFGGSLGLEVTITKK